MILPLSMPGIISGVTMVFLPAMTNYVVLDMVYNSTYIMGSLIGSYFNTYDWNNGSMISMVLLFIIFGITWITGKITGDDADIQREVQLCEKERITDSVAYACRCIFVSADLDLSGV